MDSDILDFFHSKSESRKRQYDIAYMDMAKRWSLLSLATKKQVGALIVKDRMIISDGFNGTPTGFDNKAENQEGKTHWYTLHAEANAILKLAASTQSSKGATLYLTCAPCKECSKLIYQSGISRVLYDEDYNTNEGVLFLKKAGIKIHKLNEIKNNFTDIVDAFEIEKDAKKYSLVCKAMHSAFEQQNFDAIDKSAKILLQLYSDNIGLLRLFLLETNNFKGQLKNRNSVYVRTIQVCDSLGLNINEFLSGLN